MEQNSVCIAFIDTNVNLKSDWLGIVLSCSATMMRGNRATLITEELFKAYGHGQKCSIEGRNVLLSKM